MDMQALEKARQARDPRFDGRFFIAVKTTGIYCRPVCKVRMPLAKNITFYTTAAAAQEAGFRPCLRCRPESAPGTPAWCGTSATVTRGLRLIGEGALDDNSVEHLSDRLGVTTRHLSRLFVEHLGATPIEIALTRRLHTAKKLIDETGLPMTDIALIAGYGSVRRFNEHFQKVYNKTPSSLRGSSSLTADGIISLRLPYRPPYDFTGILAFLALRAIPGVEYVTAETYQRSIVVNDRPAWFKIWHQPDIRCVVADIALEDTSALMWVVDGIKRIFDLNADPMEVNSVLSQDRQLAPLISENPGQRVPGAWNPFEISVRAIVGQQISVKGATTVMGRIASLYGRNINDQQYFPTAEQLAQLDPEALPMPKMRANAIKHLATAVQAGEVTFDLAQGTQTFIEHLVSLKGIGGWTARYIAMRALNDPDAFLHDDLVLLKVAKTLLGVVDAKNLETRSVAWRPWRAYAGMHLWRQASLT